MPDRGDEELLLAAGAGDRAAFGLLVERHQRTVLQFVYRFLGAADRDEAEDLAQDAFANAWQAARSFRPRAKVLTWLLRITTNVCLNYRRSRRLRRTRSLEAGGVSDVPGLESPPADSSSLSRDEAVHIRVAVADLPPGQRAAIVLRHFHDLSYGEIAAVLEVSVSAVESLLFRARRSLGRSLAPIRDSESPQVSSELGAESC